MRTNRLLLAAAATVVAFALTGCGGDDGGSKVPTAGGGEARTGTTGTAGQEGGGDELAVYVQGQRDYVKCLRENGVDAPDPDEKGHIDFASGGDLLKLKQDPKFEAATKKCASHRKAAPESIELGNQPKLTADQIKVKQQYAECMQKNGAADFPDPGPDGLGQGEWDQVSAGAKRAIRICGPIVGVPENPGPGKG
jgi:hypothetical protein